MENDVHVSWDSESFPHPTLFRGANLEMARWAGAMGPSKRKAFATMLTRPLTGRETTRNLLHDSPEHGFFGVVLPSQAFQACYPCTWRLNVLLNAWHCGCQTSGSHAPIQQVTQKCLVELPFGKGMHFSTTMLSFWKKGINQATEKNVVIYCI